MYKTVVGYLGLGMVAIKVGVKSQHSLEISYNDKYLPRSNKIGKNGHYCLYEAIIPDS